MTKPRLKPDIACHSHDTRPYRRNDDLLRPGSSLYGVNGQGNNIAARAAVYTWRYPYKGSEGPKHILKCAQTTVGPTTQMNLIATEVNNVKTLSAPRSVARDVFTSAMAAIGNKRPLGLPYSAVPASDREKQT